MIADFLDRVVTSVIAPEGQGRWIEYAGGYSDMLAQRGSDLKEKTVKGSPAYVKAAKTPSSAPAAGAPKRRLTFKDKHALETLPKTMAKLQAEIAKLQAKLDDPTLFTRDRKAFDAASNAMAKAHSNLTSAEEQWLELELLREEIGGSSGVNS